MAAADPAALLAFSLFAENMASSTTAVDIEYMVKMHNRLDLFLRQARSPWLIRPGAPCCCCLMLLSPWILSERFVKAAVKSYAVLGLCIDIINCF